MNLFTIGLGLITISWVYQAFFTISNKDTHIQKLFLILYSAGALMLTFGGIMGNDVIGAILNGFTVIIGLLLLYKIKKNKTK